MNIIAFYIISSITVLSCLSVVFSSNTVHSVLFLIFTFFNVSILFLFSNAEFLAMTLIIVYVGAVAVLFLFVVMMLNINEVLIKEGFLKYFPFGFILITIFILELFFVFKDITLKNTLSSKMKISELLNKGNTNTESIGIFLYTDFFIVFQISGFLLLVAMIGAIVLAKNENLNIKSQKIIYQKSLDKKRVIKLK